MKAEKQSIPIFIDEEGEPKAFIFYNKNRDRIIYTVTKAGEDELIEILECKEKKVKVLVGLNNLVKKENESEIVH